MCLRAKARVNEVDCIDNGCRWCLHLLLPRVTRLIRQHHEWQLLCTYSTEKHAVTSFPILVAKRVHVLVHVARDANDGQRLRI